MIFLESLGKMVFLFPENMILLFGRKMKDDLSQKKYVEIWHLLQMFQKDSLSKKSHRNMIFLVTSGKAAFIFLEKIFFLGVKWKMIFLKKYTEIWQIFLAPLKTMVLILEKMILAF